MIVNWKPRDFLCMIFILLLLLIGLSACRVKETEAIDPILTTVVTTNEPILPTDTPVPSPTPQPGVVILLAPAGSDTGMAVAAKDLLTELAMGDGLIFQESMELSPEVWESDVRLLVALAPDPGLSALAAEHPNTQFLAIGVPDLQPAPNLSVLGVGESGSDQQGFVAGYLAAVITQDWRIGVISRSDSSAGKVAEAGYVNGAIFYCGLCRPAYPPFYQYPVLAGVPAGASQADQQAAADILLGSAVQTVYIAPGVGDIALLEYLAERGVNMIGSVSPPAQVQNNWVATIQVDWTQAVREAWPRWMNGEGGLLLEGGLEITDRNESLFSPGRQLYVERMLADLLAGFIDTGVDPNTGEPE